MENVRNCGLPEFAGILYIRTRMKIFPLFLALLCGIPAAIAAPPGYNLAKEKGAIYLKDILEEDQKITFKVLRSTTVYSNKDATGALGTLDGNQNAELIAFSPFALRVRGKGTNGFIVGWVNPRDLEAPSPDVLENLKKTAERREQVVKLIAAKEVALGMTTGEVSESWGTPTKQESRVTADGRADVWEFIEYEIVPRYEMVRDPYNGQVYRRLVAHEKIEKGKSTVEFKEGIVTGVSEKVDNSRRRELLVVPAPCEFRF